MIQVQLPDEMVQIFKDIKDYRLKLSEPKSYKQITIDALKMMHSEIKKA